MPIPEIRLPRRPWTLIVLTAIIGAEALVLLALAIFYAVSLAAGQATVSPGGAAFTLVLLVLFSGWLFTVAFFLLKGYRWTRAAALVAQLFGLAIGVPTATGGFTFYGFLIIVPCLAAILLLFGPRVMAATQRTGQEPQVH